MDHALTDTEALDALVANGCRPGAAARLVKAFRLMRRRRAQLPPRALDSPDDVYALVMQHIVDDEREQLIVVVLDVLNRPRAVERVAVGSIDHCSVDARDVFGAAIRHSGTAIIVAHNHPSGDPTPSAADLELTRRLVRGGALLNIPLLDHLVIGTGPYVAPHRAYVSLATSGEIGEARRTA